MCLAKNIRYLRKKKNFSQDYIAEKLGYKSYTTVQKWEMGVSEPSIAKLRTLAEIFGVDINDMTSKDIEKAELGILDNGSTGNVAASSLTDRDKRDIAKDLDRMMDMLDSGEDGPIRYNGEEIDDESRVLLRNALELGLTQLKKENKRLYDPTKNKKDK